MFSLLINRIKKKDCLQCMNWRKLPSCYIDFNWNPLVHLFFSGRLENDALRCKAKKAIEKETILLRNDWHICIRYFFFFCMNKTRSPLIFSLHNIFFSFFIHLLFYAYGTLFKYYIISRFYLFDGFVSFALCRRPYIFVCNFLFLLIFGIFFSLSLSLLYFYCSTTDTQQEKTAIVYLNIMCGCMCTQNEY